MQSGGAGQKFEFQNIPAPHEIRGRILKMAGLDARREVDELREDGGVN